MNDLVILLKKELLAMNEAGKILKYSFDLCHKIGIKENYLLEEMDHFEAFTSRFARLSDLLIQKVFRLIDQLDFDDEGTVRDRINRAEKKRLIESAEEFFSIRIVRNDIAYEYECEEIKEIYKKVFELTPILLKSLDSIHLYVKKFSFS